VHSRFGCGCFRWLCGHGGCCRLPSVGCCCFAAGTCCEAGCCWLPAAEALLAELPLRAPLAPLATLPRSGLLVPGCALAAGAALGLKKLSIVLGALQKHKLGISQALTAGRLRSPPSRTGALPTLAGANQPFTRGQITAGGFATQPCSTMSDQAPEGFGQGFGVDWRGQLMANSRGGAHRRSLHGLQAKTQQGLEQGALTEGATLLVGRTTWLHCYPLQATAPHLLLLLLLLLQRAVGLQLRLRQGGGLLC
jgi:hypothetical protein